ncbi:MAG: DNA-3-methyladenine glycosylase I [Flavobacteriales bacterium]|jgi:DNA-3-methyladenine glycosylase I
MSRCAWAEASPLEIRYHDEEWGVPVHDDTQLFEMLTLESAQSGLSWVTILNKREGYRRAFKGFEIGVVAKYTEADCEKLLANAEIVRHKQKINACIGNAKCILQVQKEYGSFDTYIWSFVDGKPLQNTRKNPDEIPSSTTVSEHMSKSLKTRGFKFIGPTTCYAFMQASGMVNDHQLSCFRYALCNK